MTPARPWAGAAIGAGPPSDASADPALRRRARGSLTLAHARALPKLLAEEAGRPEHQHDDQHDERDDVLPLGAEEAGAVVLHQAEHRPPSRAPRRLPMPPSTAAVNALTPSRKPMLNSVPRSRHVEDGGPAGHDAAEQERQHDDAVDVDAHQRAVSASWATARMPRRGGSGARTGRAATIMTSAARSPAGGAPG